MRDPVALDQSPSRLVSDVLPEANGTADWRMVRALHQQRVEALDENRPSHVADELMKDFADAMRQVSSSYSGNERQLCMHALAVMANIENHEEVDLELFRLYYDDSRLSPASGIETRRRPSTFESVVETARRLRDVNMLVHAFSGTRSSALLCGSMHYGRFSDVRGGRGGEPASDLDVIVVLESIDALDDVLRSLAKLRNVSVDSVRSFERRCEIYRRLAHHDRMVFSHKFELWPQGSVDEILPAGVAEQGYPLSIHFLTRSVLGYILVASTPQLHTELAGERRTITDYRETATQRKDHLRTFAGRNYYMDLDIVQAEGGWLRKSRVYHVDERGSYCPGFYQTILLPSPEVLWDGAKVSSILETFHRKISSRMDQERRTTERILRPSFAHPRRSVFSSAVIKFIDSHWKWSG
jgi:hypothetical protein